MCDKRAYRSRNAVKAAQRSNGKRVRAYFCPVCKHWHATTEPPRTRRQHRPDSR